MPIGVRYTEEFKRDAVAQITDRGYSVKEVAERLGVCTKSLYGWKRQFHKPAKERKQETTDSTEVRRLKAETVASPLIVTSPIMLDTYS
ncbi:transposase [Kordiimonas pumila]|uniref:Transposase n=1 Tax=Kordiimonas pumila TaxID=2161677 RepID=A0ABV7D6J4_9PROT